MGERKVCTIKDRCRSIVHSTPYRRMPTLLVDAVVDRGTLGINGFPLKTGISMTMSAQNLLEGKPNLDYNTLSLSIGACVQLYEGTMNTTKHRSVGAIALNPSNERGRHYFMSLRTCKKLHRYIWTELPIMNEVIEQVEQLGEQDDEPLMMHGPYFE